MFLFMYMNNNIVYSKGFIIIILFNDGVIIVVINS